MAGESSRRLHFRTLCQISLRKSVKGGAHWVCWQVCLDALEAGLLRDGHMLNLKLIKGWAVHRRPGPPGHCIAVQDGWGAPLVGQRLAQHCCVPAGMHWPG